MKPAAPQPALKITLDTTFAGTNPTGVGLYSRRLAHHISRLCTQENLALSCIGPSCGGNQSAGLLATLQEWPIFTQAVVPVFVASQGSRIVHSTSHLGPFSGPGRKIITVHDLLFLRYPGDYNPIWLAVTNALLPIVLKRSATIIADSAATARDIQRFYRVHPSKVKVIYPGVDRFTRNASGDLDEQTDSEEAEASEPYILFPGPWVGRKNLGVLVSAFERVAEDFENVRLVITGSTPRGMKGNSPADLVAKLPRKLRHRVHFTGHVPLAELEELLRGASLLAYPSRAEGFGLPPLEAMSVGVPVVAADTLVAREVYGEAALYAPPNDVEAWAERIKVMLTDEPTRRKLTAAGLKRSGLFTWERCAEECVALYRQLLV